MGTQLNQNSTPLFNAVKKYVDDNVIPFHVPGHKHGAGLAEFSEYIGNKAFHMDVNGMDDLDYINNPTGAILEAEKLLANAYGAQSSFFLVNGSTSGIQAMILSTCKPGSKIILPRNAHKSTIGGIILSGAVPVYVQPEINMELGIATGVSTDSIKEALKKHPHADAVFIINPTYYGITSNLKSIVRLAHQKSMTVLVDEAHGAHMPFHDEFPLTAMEAGADMSTVSLHKTGGSLTQSSALLLKDSSDTEKVSQVLNLTYTSSASYLLLCSLDIARKQLFVNGKELLEETLSLARWARKEINNINGLYAFGKEITGSPGCFDFDETKLVINVSQLGLSGYKVESILRKDYNIQVEMSDLYNILAMVTIGDCKENLIQLVNALKNIEQKCDKTKQKIKIELPDNPEMIISPRDAFYSTKKSVGIVESVNEIAGEMIMAYPPGIPVIVPGERITKDVIDYIKKLKEENCQLQGMADPQLSFIRILGESHNIR